MIIYDWITWVFELSRIDIGWIVTRSPVLKDERKPFLQVPKQRIGPLMISWLSCIEGIQPWIGLPIGTVWLSTVFEQEKQKQSPVVSVARNKR